MMKAKQGKRSILKVISAILAVIVVILFASAVMQINRSAHRYTVDYGIRDYIYSAEMGRFDNLYDTAISDMYKDADYTAEEEECRALAFYYEQAVLEHAYRVTGDDAKADEFAQRMKEYEAQLGSLSSKTEVVQKAISG